MEERLRARSFFAIAILTAACTAALFAHVGIDLVGDYLVPHDAYDDLPHASRLTAGLAGLAFTAALAVALCVRAYIEARTGNRAFRRALATAMGRSPLRFCATATLTTVPLVGSMGLFDALLSGGGVPGLGALFGGSLALGTCVAALCATACALAVRGALGWMLQRCATIVAVLGRAIARLSARPRSLALRPRAGDRRVPLCRGAVRVRENSGKRGPPLPA